MTDQIVTARQQPEPGELQGALSVVIGAGSGIGAAIAQAFADAGSRLVLAGRSRERLAQTYDLATQAGATADIETVDVSAPASLEAFAERVLRQYGPPTVLVNSAGGPLTKPALDVTVDEWDGIQDAHLRGTFFACQLFARGMVPAGYGKIINLSSTWATTVGPGRSVYAAAKAGVSHLTAALAAEWAPLGIRVNALAPTATLSPSREQMFSGDPQRQQWLLERIPLGRLATPADMVGPALFLASPASDFVTGHTLFVDGGWQHSK